MGHYFRWSFNVLEWNENSKEPMTCRTNRHCNCQWSQPLDEPTALHHVVERISFHFQPYYMLLALPLITIIFFFCCSALLISLLLQQCNGNFGSLLRAALSVEHSTELLCFYLQRWLFSTMVRVYKFSFRKKIFRVENMKLLGSGMASHKCILNAESRTIATGILQQLIILSCHSMKKLWKRCKKNAMEIRIMPSAHRCVDPLKCIMQNWRLSRFVCGSGIFCLRAICTQKCHSVSKASQINAIILIEMSKIIS